MVGARPARATLKVVAAHQVVSSEFPRPVTDRGELARAVGRAIDSAVSRYGYESRSGRRPTVAGIVRHGLDVFDAEVRDADLDISVSDRAELESQIRAAVPAFRKTPVFGLPRPRSRLIVVDGRFGVYAQPDFWDGATAFYELKSFRAFPAPPDVALQLNLFQLGFPGLRSWILSLDRHSRPVEVRLDEFPRAPEPERRRVLRLAAAFAAAHGEEKVAEYVDSPMVHYRLEGKPPE